VGTEENGGAAGWDVLEVPLAAGLEALARLGRRPLPGPVRADRERAYFAVPPGCAGELPGLLEWLEWGGVPLDLRARDRAAPGGRGGVPPGTAGAVPGTVWLRPPVPGARCAAPLLPALAPPGGPVSLAGLVAALATACHRVRLASAPGAGRREISCAPSRTPL
jgi:hypothetical protein